MVWREELISHYRVEMTSLSELPERMYRFRQKNFGKVKNKSGCYLSVIVRDMIKKYIKIRVQGIL